MSFETELEVAIIMQDNLFVETTEGQITFLKSAFARKKLARNINEPLCFLICVSGKSLPFRDLVECTFHENCSSRVLPL